jgi:hypothetical protein
MIAAGIGDDAALLFNGRQRRDLVVSPAQFEGSDGLLVFRLEKELAVGSRPFDQLRTGSNAVNMGLRFADVIQSDDGNSPG